MPNIENFIDDLILKLERRGMITRSDGKINITDKGNSYVKKFLEKYPEVAILVWLSTP
ncbi:hypothetical protein M0R04_08735 [Candidatus Dojkabacteria bacterium]|nr:hypothetical protein [Candidatus Dojkabacteria bacterium]